MVKRGILKIKPTTKLKNKAYEQDLLSNMYALIRLFYAIINTKFFVTGIVGALWNNKLLLLRL